MILRLPLSLLFLVLICTCRADPTSCQVTTRNGQQLIGTVDGLEFDYTPTSFTLTFEDGTERLLRDAEIRFLRIGQRKFTGALLPVYMAMVETEEGRGFQYDFDTILVQHLVEGKKNLFEHRSKHHRSDNFYIGSDTGIHILQYGSFTLYDNRIRTRIELDDYKAQLFTYLEACATLQELLRRTHYDETSMLTVFKRYYAQCAARPPSYTFLPPTYRLDWSAVFGAQRNAISFESDRYPQLVNAGLTPEWNTAAALRVDLIFPRFRERWAITNEFMLHRYGFDEEVTYRKGIVLTEDVSGKVRYHVDLMAWHGLMRYQHTIAHWPVQLSVGGFICRRLTEENIWMEEGELKGPALDKVADTETGYTLGIGTTYGPWGLEFRQEYTSGFSDMPTVSQVIWRSGILLRYRFWKQPLPMQ